MCLIIHQKKGYTLPFSQLKTIGEQNKDGFGLMYAKDGKLYTMRMVGTQTQVLDAYYAYAANQECLIHWRLSTSGDINVPNAHPFVLGNSQIAMMHNGVIDIGQPYDSMSDTHHFAEFMLKPIAEAQPEFVMGDEFRKVCQGLVGAYNKVALMNSKGEVSIMNKAGGVMFEGNWFSNTYAWNAPSHLLPKVVGYTGRSGYRGSRFNPVTKQWDTLWGDEAEDYDVTRDPVKYLPASTTKEVTSTVESLTPKITDWDLGDLKLMVAKDGEEGAMKWAEEYPVFAKKLINEWYDLDISNLRPETMAEFLMEIANVDDATTPTSNK